MVARHQGSFVGSACGLVVGLIVGLTVRLIVALFLGHVAVLTWSPWEVVVVSGGVDGLKSVGCRKGTIGWVVVVVVEGKHDIGFDGVELVDIYTIRDCLVPVGTVKIWSVTTMEKARAQSLTHIRNRE